jgi:ArsR family transcriptional regulator
MAPKTSADEQRRFFDERADGYGDALFRSRWPRNQLLKARLVAELLDAPPGTRVLELGCGTGQIAEELVAGPAALDYLGVDLAPRMVEAAGRRLARFGDRVEMRTGEIEQLALPSGSLGGAFAIDVLHHVPDPIATLAELRRIVAPGGRVVFLESNPKFPVTTIYALAHREEHAVLRFTRRRLRGWFERAGLVNVRVELGSLFTPPGPPALVPLYDRIDSVAARVPGVRALAIFYVARGEVAQ